MTDPNREGPEHHNACPKCGVPAQATSTREERRLLPRRHADWCPFAATLDRLGWRAEPKRAMSS